MKKLILEILKKYYGSIVNSWTDRFLHDYGDKISGAQLRTFVESTLQVIIDIIKKGVRTEVNT